MDNRKTPKVGLKKKMLKRKSTKRAMDVYAKKLMRKDERGIWRARRKQAVYEALNERMKAAGLQAATLDQIQEVQNCGKL